MTQHTNTTSGAADLRATFSEMLVDLPNTEPFTLFKAGFDAALAAGQTTAAPAQPAAQQGAAYAALPDERAAFEAQFPVPGGVHWDGTEYVVKDSHVTSYRCNRFEGQWEAWKARASHGQAPAGATEEVENLRKALVYAAFALHDTPQYMLAQGIALIDGDTVRVSRDGWTVEASVNPHRQPAPAPPPECETEAEKRAFAFGWFKALESERMKAESVPEDAALWHWLAEYLVGPRTDLDDEIVASETVNDLRNLVGAAIKQGEKQ